MIKKILIYI